MQGRICLVTGAAGFIGSHMVRRLVAEGAQVHALVRPGSAPVRLEALCNKIRMAPVDLHDACAVRSAVAAARPDLVFHFAGQNRGLDTASPDAARKALAAILPPAINLIDALAQLPAAPRAVVRAGTIAEYGLSSLPYRESDREKPVNAYGAAMLAATRTIEMLAPGLAFPVTTARLALTYGPGQSDAFLIPRLVDAAICGRSVEVRRPGDRRDLIHVDDVVSAMLALACARDPRSRIINIGTGAAPSMREVAAEIVSASGCSPALIVHRAQSAGEKFAELRSDPSLARALYGWSPQCSLRQGIRQLVAGRRTPGQSHHVPDRADTYG